MKNLYKKIIATLQLPETVTKFTEAGIKPVQLIDDYEGQYFDPENFEVFTPPAVLFEYDIEYDKTNKPATAIITLHLCYEQPTSANTNNPNIDRALKRYDFNDLVYNAIKDLESEHTGKLKLESEGSLKEPAIVKVHLMRFSCSYTGKIDTIDDDYDYDYAQGEELETDGEIVPWNLNFDVDG